MNKAGYQLSLSEIPLVAGLILNNFKRDWSLFEKYSAKFDREFLVSFEEKVNSLVRLDPIQALENKIVQINQKIDEIIGSFWPVIDLTETFLRSVPIAMGFRVAGLDLKELVATLKERCVPGIQKSCLNLICRLELHTEEFLDKGFIQILLNNYHLLIDKLSDLKIELEEHTRRHDMITQVYLYVDNQLKDFMETIIESTPSVFGESNADKREQYSIENMMVQGISKGAIVNNLKFRSKMKFDFGEIPLRHIKNKC